MCVCVKIGYIIGGTNYDFKVTIETIKALDF